MTRTLTPGSETPATFGGPGFQPRQGEHSDDIGGAWGRCGVSDEHRPLKSVLMRWPGEELEYTDDPDHWLHLEKPDLSLLRRQAEAIAAVLESRGCRVRWLREPAPSPNLLFMRDTFWMTPEGAILGRMGSQQRAGEERYTARALAAADIPILSTPRGAATFEGADALWVDARTVFVGQGRRTNSAGLRHLQQTLGEGVEWMAVPLPGTTQHLLGVLNFIDARHVGLWEGRSPPALIDALRARGFRTLMLPDGPELSEGRAMNWVCLGPNEVLMPSGCPDTRDRLRAAGVGVYEADVGEYLKAGGALGCLVGILERS
ncbi:MAG: N-dimethylarginine dimethylaminohydrolase [Myxococcota bacterium]|jgi:N-dimethylarginine dimethylaminohydrolase